MAVVKSRGTESEHDEMRLSFEGVFSSLWDQDQQWPQQNRRILRDHSGPQTWWSPWVPQSPVWAPAVTEETWPAPTSCLWGATPCLWPVSRPSPGRWVKARPPSFPLITIIGCLMIVSVVYGAQQDMKHRAHGLIIHALNDWMISTITLSHQHFDYNN